MIEIHFHRSSSKYYKEVLRYAKSFRLTEGEPNVVRIESADELFGSWDDFCMVFHKVKLWSGTTIFHHGNPIIQSKDKNDWFYSLQELYICYYKFYRKSYDKSTYCNDGGCWGCKKLNSVVRYITSSFWDINYWFSYGRFIDQSTWKVNKQQILMILMEESFQRRIDICPAFTKIAVKGFVDRLPDTIFIDDVNWRIKYVDDFRESGQVKVPVGIEPIISENPEVSILELPLQEEFVRKQTEDEWADMLIEEYLRSKRV